MFNEITDIVTCMGTCRRCSVTPLFYNNDIVGCRGCGLSLCLVPSFLVFWNKGSSEQYQPNLNSSPTRCRGKWSFGVYHVNGVHISIGRDLFQEDFGIAHVECPVRGFWKCQFRPGKLQTAYCVTGSTAHSFRKYGFNDPERVHWRELEAEAVLRSTTKVFLSSLAGLSKSGYWLRPNEKFE